MPYTKTAISIERSVFEAAEELARELHISRSDLYTRALKALLRERKMYAMQDQINAAEAALKHREHADTSMEAEELHRAASAAMRRSIERGESTW